MCSILLIMHHLYLHVKGTDNNLFFSLFSCFVVLLFFSGQKKDFLLMTGALLNTESQESTSSPSNTHWNDPIRKATITAKTIGQNLTFYLQQNFPFCNVMTHSHFSVQS